MKIFNNLEEISNNFDLFLFDAYGVFWEGNGFYKGSREVMANLVALGKTVVVISNTTQLSPQIMASYTKRNLLEGRDYNYFVSSGDVLRQNLVEQNIQFSTKKNPHKYYVIGKPNALAFANTNYQQVEKMENADFIYCGVPYMYANDVAKYSQFANEYWPVKCDETGNIEVWDTLTDEPFKDIVSKAVQLGLPAVNANPDYFAKEGHSLVKNSEAVFVVRNGSLAKLFREQGTEVLEFGKPHKNIFEYTFKLLEQNGIKVEKNRTCMIGDTVRTDIKGAINADIAPVLCVNTGVTAWEISLGNTVENLCDLENIDVKQIIQIKSVGDI